jgi:quercetin dioxygenase-like cupin family protein
MKRKPAIATISTSFGRPTEASAMPSDSLPLRIDPAPDPIDRELEPLLSEPLAEAWESRDADAASGMLRRRVLERVSSARAASAGLATVRLKRLAATELAPGVSARTLYLASRDRALRPGEPARARWVELKPGSRWEGPDANCHREWLVLRGEARIGDEALSLRDYHGVPAGCASAAVSSEQGAWLFLRESDIAASSGDAPFTVRDAEAGWPDYAPGIRRRVLWQRDGQAALLYHTQPGASVPSHSHGHDEECLMVQGELFLDDVLLQEGDYQLAPAGTGHRITETDTGVVLYAHGDLDLKFVA